jgi:hypothetical protein
MFISLGTEHGPLVLVVDDYDFLEFLAPELALPVLIDVAPDGTRLEVRRVSFMVAAVDPAEACAFWGPVRTPSITATTTGRDGWLVGTPGHDLDFDRFASDVGHHLCE